MTLFNFRNGLNRCIKSIAARNGAIIPLFDDMDLEERCVVERHVSIDTTASGGNVSLLAGV